MGGAVGNTGDGGLVVGGPSPLAAFTAAGYQSSAANSAAQAAQQQINMAINELRSQYANAFVDLKPYTQTGIQALNELNQYMGLSAYNPGTAPTAPEMPTIESLAKRVTSGQIDDYVMRHVAPSLGPGGQWFGWMNYQGAGKDLPDMYPTQVTRAPGVNQSAPNSLTPIASWGGESGAPNVQAIREQLAKDQLQQAMDAYNAEMKVYNQQMDMYNYAQNLYDQYSAQGPLTPDQVMERLSNTPGYQFQLGQGVDAIQRAASASGALGSGRVLQALADYGQGLASQTYGDHLSRLASLAGAGQQASSQLAGSANDLGNSIAGLRANLGDTLANSALATGNAMSQAAVSAGTRYNIIGGGGGGSGGMGGIGQLAGSVLGMFGGGGGGGAGGLMGLFG